MTDIDLDAIEARARAATSGPWTCEKTPANCFWVDAEFLSGTSGICDLYHREGRTFWHRENDKANATFIAHAREDIPALIAALRAEREKSAQLEVKNARLRATLNHIAFQKTEAELIRDGFEDPAFNEGYDALIDIARQAIGGDNG